MGIPEQLHKMLFSFDFNKHIQAARYIKENLSSAQEISDLLIKWIFFRLWGNCHVVATESILDMAEAITNCLKAESYILDDQLELCVLLSAINHYMQQFQISANMNVVCRILDNLKSLTQPSKLVAFFMKCIQNAACTHHAQIAMIFNKVFLQNLELELAAMAKIQHFYEDKELLFNLKQFYTEPVLRNYGFNFLAKQVPLKTTQPTDQQPLAASSQPQAQTQPENKGPASTCPLLAGAECTQSVPASGLPVQQLSRPSPKQEQFKIREQQTQQLNSMKPVDRFHKCIDMLISGGTASSEQWMVKQSAIDILKQLISGEPEIKDYLKGSINQTTNSFLVIFRQDIKERNSKQSPCAHVPTPYQYISGFLNLFEVVYIQEKLALQLDYERLLQLTRVILTQLLLEYDIKSDSQGASTDSHNLVTLLNNFMIRLMETAALNSIMMVFLDLLIENKKVQLNEEYTKGQGIIIRCLLKCTKWFVEEKQLNIESVLLKFYEYVQQFKTDQNQNQEVGIKAIKTMLYKLVEVLGAEKITAYFNKATGNVQSTQGISDMQMWIQGFILKIYGAPSLGDKITPNPQMQMDPSSTGKLASNASPLRNFRLSHMQNRLQQTQQLVDPQIKAVADTLINSNFMDRQALSQMADFIQKTPGNAAAALTHTHRRARCTLRFLSRHT